MKPDEAERLLDRGVVTLSDSNYYPGLLQLHASIQTSDPCPVLCYDIGLSAAQRDDANRRHNLQVLDLPADPLIAELVEATRDAAPLAKPGKRIWPLWICPLLIRAAPLRDVFWLDCDAVVLRGLDELFAMLDGRAGVHAREQGAARDAEQAGAVRALADRAAVRSAGSGRERRRVGLAAGP